MTDASDGGSTPPCDGLREALDAFVGRAETDGPSARLKLTDQNLLDLLRTISEFLKPLTDKVICEIDDTLVVTDHPAIALLDEHIDAIEDRDKPAAALSRKQRKLDQALLEAALVVQRARGLKTIAAADDQVERALRRKGYLRRGKAIRHGTIKRLRDRPQKDSIKQIPAGKIRGFVLTFPDVLQAVRSNSVGRRRTSWNS